MTDNLTRARGEVHGLAAIDHNGRVSSAGRVRRCAWAGEDPLYVAYHDLEWGVPLRDDRALFEMLVLEGAQAGLSWITILRRRETYRFAFDGFDPALVAGYDARRVARLLRDPGIIRNRAKVEAAVANARVTLALQQEHGSLSEFLWGFAGGRPIVHRYRTMSELQAQSAESRAMSRELRRRGMKFVGPTICHAFMQSVGMFNDHLTGCFRWREVGRPVRRRR
jgi:DNA-3-methyladenine glycosylase I